MPKEKTVKKKSNSTGELREIELCLEKTGIRFTKDENGDLSIENQTLLHSEAISLMNMLNNSSKYIMYIDLRNSEIIIHPKHNRSL